MKKRIEKFENFKNNALNESGLTRLYKHMENHDAGIITANRYKEGCAEEDGKIYTSKENELRNRHLAAKIQTLGYYITKVKGKFIENYKTPHEKDVNENSFFVVDYDDIGNLKDVLLELAEDYGQDSVLWIPSSGEVGYLIGTSHCPGVVPGYHEVIPLQRTLGKRAQFHTIVNGRPFVYHDIYGLLESNGIYNRYKTGNNSTKSMLLSIAKKPFDKYKEIQEQLDGLKLKDI